MSEIQNILGAGWMTPYKVNFLFNSYENGLYHTNLLNVISISLGNISISLGNISISLGNKLKEK